MYSTVPENIKQMTCWHPKRVYIMKNGLHRQCLDLAEHEINKLENLFDDRKYILDQ